MVHRPDPNTEKSEMRVMWIGSLAIVLLLVGAMGINMLMTHNTSIGTVETTGHQARRRSSREGWRSQMFNHEITSVQLNRPCPVCGSFMKLLAIDSKPWSARTMGERLRFRCASCGMTQSEWSAIAVATPGTAPD